MDDVTFARALHVLAVVHWIGGVAMVTAVILPALGGAASARLALFLAVEQRFSRQARWSVALAGVTGFYMTHRLEAWARFLEPGFWWMHAMVLVWTVFALMLFVVEPLFLHRRLQRLAERDQPAALRLAQRGHVVLLSISALAIAAAVLGAHGAIG
jgi:uncharacterized membrane protein